MSQQSLFGDLAGAGDLSTVADHAPYVRGSATSEAAAEEIKPAAGTLRALVYEAIQEAGDEGCTDEEIQLGRSLNPSTQRPRRIEALKAGLIVDSGRKRPTSSGRAATVWIAKEFAR